MSNLHIQFAHLLTVAENLFWKTWTWTWQRTTNSYSNYGQFAHSVWCHYGVAILQPRCFPRIVRLACLFCQFQKLNWDCWAPFYPKNDSDRLYLTGLAGWTFYLCCVFACVCSRMGSGAFLLSFISVTFYQQWPFISAFLSFFS